MSWRDLLKKDEESVTLPWTGGRSLHAANRTFKLSKLPREFGWYRFSITHNTASDAVATEPTTDLLKTTVSGYLVGDHLVPDNIRVDPDPAKIFAFSEKVYLLSDNLDRFSRVRAGRIYPEGPLIFLEQAFPLGPENDVMNAYLDRKTSVHEIPGVVPALDAAFRMEMFQREQAEIRHQERLRREAEEEAARVREARRKEVLERVGDGQFRRQLARENFQEAAKAALAIGNAEYLDHRSVGDGEWAVKYRVDGQRLECICDTNLRIVNAGVCLTDHHSGEKGDTYFTLESLPSVIREAMEEDKLVIWRHV